ncbi:MAG: hypothetical protein IT207_02475 [Fimbriimonadaceae bacterium]|nr:hypothetical protein [Fimbriimonadaceae bacterium]
MQPKKRWIGFSLRRVALLFLIHLMVGIAFVRLWEAPSILGLAQLAYPPGCSSIFVFGSEEVLRISGAWREPVPWPLYALLFTAVTYAVTEVGPASGVRIVGLDGVARTDLVWSSPWVCLVAWVASCAVGLAVRPRPS